MKAVILEANGKLSLCNIPVPNLHPNECMIKIKYTGICSSDIYRAYENGAYNYPLIMGHEVSGEIVETGHDVKNFSIGDQVIVFPLKPCFNCEFCAKYEYARCNNYSYYGSRCNGGFSEFLNVNEWNLIKVPGNIGLDNAALVEPMSVVIHALRQVDRILNFSWDNRQVLIIGMGFLGLLAVRMLANPGARVTVVDRNSFKLDIAQKYGAYTVLIDSDVEWDKYIKAKAKSFDVVIEATGSPVNFIRSIQTANNGAAVIWIGNITGNLNVPKSVVSSILRKEISILGTWNSSYKSPLTDDWNQSIEIMRKGLLQASLITHKVSLERLPDILSRMYNHKKGVEYFEYIKCMVSNE
jgi:L-iditol 2-dehydrogenase